MLSWEIPNKQSTMNEVKAARVGSFSDALKTCIDVYSWSYSGVIKHGRTQGGHLIASSGPPVVLQWSSGCNEGARHKACMLPIASQ